MINEEEKKGERRPSLEDSLCFDFYNGKSFLDLLGRNIGTVVIPSFLDIVGADLSNLSPKTARYSSKDIWCS